MSGERRLGLIGRGAIGRVIAAEVGAARVPGWTLGGVLRRRPAAADEVAGLEALLELRPDLVIEAAGQAAVQEYAAAVLESGVDLLVLSAGALADPVLEASLRSAGPGRLIIGSGALGGLDAVRGYRLSGTLRYVKLTSTTIPALAVQPWMAHDERERILRSEVAVRVYGGSARELASRFPQSANVAATVGLATLGLDEVRAELRADPAATRKRHVLHAVSDIGEAWLTVEGVFSPDNPRTSALTPFAALRFLTDATARIVVGA